MKDVAKRYVLSAKKYKRNVKKDKRSIRLFKSKASGVKNYQVLNKIKKVYYFAESYDPSFSIMTGTGNPIAEVNQFMSSQLPRYSALISMFRQIKIIRIVYRFTLITVEQTDNSQLPTIYVRYNYNPSLLSTDLSENQMERLSNVVKKTFSHNTPQSRSFNYTMKPCVMTALHLFSSGNYVPSPKWNQWIDLDPAGTTDEIQHYGLQLFLPIVPAGQQIQCTAEVQYACRDLI